MMHHFSKINVITNFDNDWVMFVLRFRRRPWPQVKRKSGSCGSEGDWWGQSGPGKYVHTWDTWVGAEVEGKAARALRAARLVSASAVRFSSAVQAPLMRLLRHAGRSGASDSQELKSKPKVLRDAFRLSLKRFFCPQLYTCPGTALYREVASAIGCLAFWWHGQSILLASSAGGWRCWKGQPALGPLYLELCPATWCGGVDRGRQLVWKWLSCLACLL